MAAIQTYVRRMLHLRSKNIQYFLLVALHRVSRSVLTWALVRRPNKDIESYFGQQAYLANGRGEKLPLVVRQV